MNAHINCDYEQFNEYYSLVKFFDYVIFNHCGSYYTAVLLSR